MKNRMDAFFTSEGVRWTIGSHQRDISLGQSPTQFLHNGAVRTEPKSFGFRVSFKFSMQKQYNRHYEAGSG